MRKILPLLSLFIGLIIISCSSGEKALEKGDYYQAVIKSINRLRSNPSKEKARQIVAKAYPLAVNWYNKQIQQTKSSNIPLKWSRIVSNYQTLNNLAREIDRCPAAKEMIPVPNYYINELEDAKHQAAPECYIAGMEALNRGTREDAKRAFRHFMNANNYVPNYKDVVEMMDKAHYMATLKVVIEQIPLPSLRFKLSADFFQDQVDRFLGQQLKREFVRFYSPQEAQQEKLEFPDQILRIQFMDFVVGETHETSKEEIVVSADSVKVGTVTLKDGEKVPVYNKVKAKLTTHRREVISKGLLSLEIIKFQNKHVLMNNRLPGEFVWFTQWGHFNGDERALTPEELKLCNSEPVPALPPQELFTEFTRPIYTQLTESLRSFYNRY